MVHMAWVKMNPAVGSSYSERWEWEMPWLITESRRARFCVFKDKNPTNDIPWHAEMKIGTQIVFCQYSEDGHICQKTKEEAQTLCLEELKKWYRGIQKSLQLTSHFLAE